MLTFDRKRRAAPFAFGVATAGLGVALSTQTGLGGNAHLQLVGGAALLAVGIVCQVHSDFLCVPGDALVKTVAQTFKLRLSRIKTAFDATLVLAALIVSWALLRRIEGVREGTVFGVVLVGWIVGLALPRLRKSRYHWAAT